MGKTYLTFMCYERITPELLLNAIIEPTLCHLKEISFSKAASQLILGTAIHESLLKHRRQMGGGPARGLFQMEPATHNDIWDNYLKYRQKIADQVQALKSTPGADGVAELEYNDNYAAAMCRVHYYRAPGALPAFDDLDKMAAYWKQYYNTSAGKGTVEKYKKDWNAHTKGKTLYYLDSCS